MTKMACIPVSHSVQHLAVTYLGVELGEYKEIPPHWSLRELKSIP